MPHRASLKALALILFCLPAMIAQETAEKVVAGPPANTTARAPEPKAKPTSAAAKAKIEQQRSLALSLLMSLANDARSFKDQRNNK